MRKKNNVQLYTTLDAYQVGFLTLRSFIPKLIEQGDKVVFAFDASESLYQAITEYNAGAMAEAKRFALVIKNLESLASIKNKIGLWDWD